MGLIAYSDDEIGEDYDDLVQFLEDVEEEDLTDWEATFVSDMLAKLEQYGKGTFVSSAQHDVIDRLREKY